jgi:pimeloyl-ACP methyl ester carboxylesterase
MSGCGRSDGDYISLGFHEKADLIAVIDLCKERGYQTIGLWGHSMGAAIALFYMAENNV